MKEFTLKSEHLTLLRNVDWDWKDMEAGAPAMDCKRPFGNGNYENDIAEILSWELFTNRDDEKELNKEQYEQAVELYRELEYATQIVMQSAGAPIPLGKYKKDGNKWSFVP